MSLDFVAIDFETANSFRGSPCAVGLVRVLGGQIVDDLSLLVKPTPPYWDPSDTPLADYFDAFNVSIHGITPGHVEDAPPFWEAWPAILDFVDGLPLVAHYASFDTGVLREALYAADVEWPSIEYGCTVVMGRRTYDLASYRLPFVAHAAGVPFDAAAHHEASYDATVAAMILQDIAERHEVDDLAELAASLGLRLGRIGPGDWSGCKSKSHSARPGHALGAKNFVVNAEADPEGPLYGAGISFTGTLVSMTRNLAFDRVAAAGGVPLDTVTKHTNLFVFGLQDASKLSPGASISAKFAKALALREKGQDIEIIGEDDFLKMLAETEPQPQRS